MSLSPTASRGICMETRKAFQVINDAEKPIEFAELKKGMRFKLYEPDGEPVANGEILEASSDAYKNEDNISTIEIIDYTKEPCDNW